MSENREALKTMLESYNEQWQNAGGPRWTPEPGEYISELKAVRMVTVGKEGNKVPKIVLDFEVVDGPDDGKSYSVFVGKFPWELEIIKGIVLFVSDENADEDMVVAYDQLEECIEGVVKMRITNAKEPKYRNYRVVGKG